MLRLRENWPPCEEDQKSHAGVGGLPIAVRSDVVYGSGNMGTVHPGTVDPDGARIPAAVKVDRTSAGYADSMKIAMGKALHMGLEDEATNYFRLQCGGTTNPYLNYLKFILL